MNDRIKKIRRELNLTQHEFAARIGSVQNTITGYETGRRVPSNQVISLICKEFHVNESWLRTGEGEMFAPAPTAALDALAREKNLSHGEYILIEKLLGLNPEVRQGFLTYILEVAAAINADDVPANAPAFPGMTLEGLHAELDRQFTEEKKAEEKSEVS